ncbi:MAG: hypothetical protein WCK09_06845 [Bacteroidota bacterium]
MKIIAAILIACLAAGCISYAQVGINSDNSTPDNSAMLDVKSANRGLLPPRMTFEQRNAISSPANGLLVVCTNCNSDGTDILSIFLGGVWQNVTGICDTPVSPAEGIHVQSNTQIIWNWNTVPIATGYEWSPSVFPANIVATNTSNTEIGLAQGLCYTRYVWALNGCGYSDWTKLTGQALTCGSSFGVMHIAGPVAPETKTVTYGTVTNIPGEPSKCWINRNLGATQRPNSVDDNSEASAGWYWQFNRTQGYKHSGTALTPAWNTANINQNSDWESVNDPCSLLLGVAWRIPAQSEWYNVISAGGWTNWNGPWSSGLQMHAAGDLVYSTGSLENRGSAGFYWGITQTNATTGVYLNFNSAFSTMASNSKRYGFPLRCVRN